LQYRCGSTCARFRSPGTVVCHRNQPATTHPAAAAHKVEPLASRVAVISDVHANWHALQTVLEAVDRESPDELWCLGDLVGYGPRPNPCVSAVRERAALCLAGNHDLGVLGEVDLAEFAPDAVASANWTRVVLTADARAYREHLPSSGRRQRR